MFHCCQFVTLKFEKVHIIRPICTIGIDERYMLEINHGHAFRVYRHKLLRVSLLPLGTLKHGKGSHHQTSSQHLGSMRAMLHAWEATEKKTNHVHASRVYLYVMNYMFQCCPIGNTKFWERGSHNQTYLQHLGLMSNVQCSGATEENTNTNHVDGPRVYLDMMIICFQCRPVGNTEIWKGFAQSTLRFDEKCSVFEIQQRRKQTNTCACP